MIRRNILVALAALALTVAPAAAMACPPPGICAVKDTSTPPGVPFTVHASGARSNEVVTLTMTRHARSVGDEGVRRITRNASAGGEVDFPVALAQEGIWSLVSTSSTGAVLAAQTVTVADHGAVLLGGVSAGSDTATAESDTTTAGSGSATAGADTASGAGARASRGQLGRTGFQGTRLAVGGGVLILLGAGAVAAARRGRWAQRPS